MRNRQKRPVASPPEPTTPTLWSLGYGAWPAPVRAERLVEALRGRKVTRLVDIRIQPCASDLTPGHRYGPKPWTLEEASSGIVRLMESAGIAYEWMVELGNPQRHDPEMRRLREHLADSEGRWPVHRGLVRLADRVREATDMVAILCACKDAMGCHRSLIGLALSERHFEGRLLIREVVSGSPLEPGPTFGPRGGIEPTG